MRFGAVTALRSFLTVSVLVTFAPVSFAEEEEKEEKKKDDPPKNVPSSSTDSSRSEDLKYFAGGSSAPLMTSESVGETTLPDLKVNFTEGEGDMLVAKANHLQSWADPDYFNPADVIGANDAPRRPNSGAQAPLATVALAVVALALQL